MTKSIFYILLLGVLTLLCGIFLPQWWFVAVASFLTALAFKESMVKTAIISFFVVALVWFGTALYIDSANDSILSTRIGLLLGGMTPLVLTLITGILGGLVATLAGLTGASLNRAFFKS